MIGALSLLLMTVGADAGTISIGEALARPLTEPECSAPAGKDAIVVCGRRDSSRRYRVTDPDAPFDPSGTTMSVARERARWTEHGDTGIGSCSAVGPGGSTGCMLKEWRRERQQNGLYD